jgi:hypothetical protein
MTVLMTVNRSHSIGGRHCRIEWQGLAADDVVTARLVSDQTDGPVFPAEAVSGLRPQPYAPNAWLIDLAELPSGWRRLDLVIEAGTAHGVSMSVEVRPASPGAASEVLQHSGLTTVPEAPMLALRIAPEGSGWAVVPFDAVFVDAGGGGGEAMSVPDALREPAVLARHEEVARSGEPVTAVVDLSASMRPRLVAGTVAGVLEALQAVAGAADQRGVAVVGVSDRMYGPRTLEITDDAEDFLRRWVQEIGWRTGLRGTGEQWVAEHRPGGLVVSVSDQREGGREGRETDPRRCRVVLAPPGDGEPVSGRAGTVLVSEPRPSAVSVVRALAHALPAV